MDGLLIQVITNGILIGGIYVLVSIGLSFAFGVMHLINVAQGDFVMLGAFTAYWLFTLFKIDPLISFLISFAIFFVVGYILQITIVKNVINAPALMNLVLFLGLSLFLSNSALMSWGPFGRMVTTNLSGAYFKIYTTAIPIVRLISFIISIIVIISLFLFLNKTRLGMGIVATYQNKESAALLGVDVDKAYAITLGIGIGTASMAGALLSELVSIFPMMGGIYTLFAFFVTVLGGMGYLPGTLIGGFLLGLIVSFAGTYYTSEAIYFIAFIILYIILLISPRGLLGRGY